METRLEDWAVVTLDPYSPPEYGLCLKGTVYNHPTKPDGTRIVTSVIVKVEGRVVRTNSNTLYHLGEPEKEYLEFCRSNNTHLPLGDNPIKTSTSGV